MYKIIGADGREYGPISADQVRQWMVEGRANLQTRILPPGATDWVTIADLLEFAGAASQPSSGAPAYVTPPGAVGLEVVNGPAIALMCVAALGFLQHSASLLSLVSRHRTFGPFSGGYGRSFAMFGNPGFGAAVGCVGLLLSAVVLLGGIKMKNLENYGLAMTASIIALLPCISPCCIIGFPIGIWALIVLAKPEVKSAFH